MAKLYVANLGHQPHLFQYRIPAGEGYGHQVHVQTLAPGTQQLVYNEAPRDTLEAIVEQHRQFGIVDAAEIIRTKKYIGLCFSFDEPVDLDKLQYAADHNKGELFDIGAQRRQEMAFAADRAVEQNLIELQRRGQVPGDARVRSVSVETLEDGDDPKFAEGIRVDHLDGGRRRA